MLTMVLSRDMSIFVQQTYVSISEWTAQEFFFTLCPSLFCHFFFCCSPLESRLALFFYFFFYVYKFSLCHGCHFSETLFIFRTASVFLKSAWRDASYCHVLTTSPVVAKLSVHVTVNVCKRNERRWPRGIGNILRCIHIIYINIYLHIDCISLFCVVHCQSPVCIAVCFTSFLFLFVPSVVVGSFSCLDK